jgi:tyrosine aminotransferase
MSTCVEPLPVIGEPSISDKLQQQSVKEHGKKKHRSSKHCTPNSEQSEPWGTVQVSYMAKNTDNPIRKIVDGMKLVPNHEKELIALSIGDPTIFGNLPLDESIEEAVIESLRTKKHNGYAPSIGYEDTRAAIAAHYTRHGAPLTSKDIILASGCSGAIDLAISVLAESGQNILVPKPGFSLYKTLAISLGIHVRYYKLIPERSWEIDLDDLEKQVDNDTACLIVNNPSNPCGSVYTAKHIRQILRLANRLKLPVIADEIYADFVFPGHPFIPMAIQTRDVPILACGGLTKKYLVPGWRMGWIMIHDRHDAFHDVRHGLVALSQRILGPNTIVQGAVRTILEKTPTEFFDKSIALVQKNAELFYDGMNKIKGLKPIMPAGAMYMMVGIEIESFPEFRNDVDFTQRLVSDQSVFCLPAQCFQYPNYFRVVLTVPEEKIRESCLRIHEFCATHYKPITDADPDPTTTTDVINEQ